MFGLRPNRASFARAAAVWSGKTKAGSRWGAMRVVGLAMGSKVGVDTRASIAFDADAALRVPSAQSSRANGGLHESAPYSWLRRRRAADVRHASRRRRAG